jgi:hypothetical protein
MEYYYANNINGGNAVKKNKRTLEYIASFIFILIIIIGAGTVGYSSSKLGSELIEVSGLRNKIVSVACIRFPSVPDS